MNKQAGVVLAAGAFVVAAITGTTLTASAAPVHVRTPLGVVGTPTADPSTTPTPGEPTPTPGEPTPTVAPTTPAAPTIISADQAKAIALAASSGGTITKFELKDEHSNKPEYRIELQNGRVRHKFRIDAFTGEITRHDVN